MWIDILFLLSISASFYWGWKQGIIHMLFTVIAYFAGMILAVVLNAKVAVFVSQFKTLPPQLLPLASFFFMLLFIILLFNLISWVLQKILQSFHLDNLNRAIGSALAGSLLTFLASIIIWYATASGMITENVKKKSITYSYLYTFAPNVLDGLAYIIPGVKSAFPLMENLMHPKNSEKPALKQV